MPSRSSKVTLASAFVTAAGLAATATGAAQNVNQIEYLGLLALTTGVIPLLLGAAADHFGRASIDQYRDQQIAAGRNAIDAHREEIEGEAFALAIELWRTGAIGGTTTSHDSLTDTGGRRYDL